MIISEKRIKRQAELIGSKFGMKHCECLEFVAKLNGFKDWDHYTKELKNEDKEQSQGFQLRFTEEEIKNLSHTDCSSSLTDQFEHFEFQMSDLSLETIQKLDDPKTCSFRFTEDFLHAKIISDFFKFNGEQTAIFWDTDRTEYVVWITKPAF